ncbi:hypothetical protein AC578_8451 [Pseudocercospora eumusae]|uniref:Rab-GAP TBC domain-containing protein n=1 Tax=Pseudocercospora eumusae TaxID=321146 RepID=A0A139H1X3_9PEZI|nr:hypothetical protein AC578_8451 [Pseudocercospora eumusae]
MMREKEMGSEQGVGVGDIDMQENNQGGRRSCSVEAEAEQHMSAAAGRGIEVEQTTAERDTCTPDTPDTLATSPSSSSSSSSSGNDSDLPTPTQESTKPIFISTTTLHDEPFDNTRLSSSPQPETPKGPSTPITPNDEHDVCRDSMASIALSESSLDYDHLSTEQVTDVLATPRVNGVRRHLRKVSSLDILQNKWPPPESQSTLFDGNDAPTTIFDTNAGDITPMSAIEFSQGRGPWDTRRDSAGELDSDFNMHRRTTNATLDSIDLLEPNYISTPALTSPSGSTSQRSSDGSGDHLQVDWQALDKTEEQEKEDRSLPEGVEDESTAFLLARLEQENAKFAADPKAAGNKPSSRARAHSRPPSMAHIKKLVADRDAPSVRYSIPSASGIPDEVPPMTELEFWAALVQDYPSTAARLPTLTTTKMRSGIPPPLRGVVWTSMAGARDRDLEEAYERLLGEKSPYEGIINKDVGRSFPGVELFRDAEGDGQKMLGRVLKCFSLHDKDIGYCQGLGFLVGPLLMNMGERDAFCVLVRLMDHYSLRPSFLPSLSGLHMRIYQFSSLLKQHHPKLHEHLADLGIEPAYLSQWFLSCFAVTCPLAMLFRIYDVIFAEGANETVMRVALSLMRRHEEKMLGTTEFEEVMQLLLGREMWGVYGGDSDILVDDFTSLGDIVTHARLSELEKEFENQSSETVGQSAGFLPDVQAAASRFLGRLWTPGHASTPSKPVAHMQKPSVSTLSPPTADKGATTTSTGFFGRPTSFLRRSPSKQSIGVVESSGSEDSTSTTGSSAPSLASTAITEPDAPNANGQDTIRESVANSVSTKSKAESMFATTPSMQQQELHAQIEDLLTAIVELQRENAQFAATLQREREERSEDQKVMRQIVGKLRKDDEDDRRRTMPPPANKFELKVAPRSRPLSVGDWTDVQLVGSEKPAPDKDELEVLVKKAQDRLQANVRFSASLETKAQLRSILARTREELAVAESRSRDLAARLDSSEASLMTFQSEAEDLRSEVRELRQRVSDDFKARQKMEHQLTELKAQARSVERKERMIRAESLQQLPTQSTFAADPQSRKGSVSSLPAGSVANAGGLRELKLGRRESSSSVQSLRQSSRNPTPISTDMAPPPPPIIRTDSTDYEASPVYSPADPSPTSETQSPAPETSERLTVHRRGFSQRTSSLATQEVFATTQHEPVPEEALVLELVNAKTSEALARQELDEVKKAMAVAKRRQEETIAQMQAEMEAAKIEAQKTVEEARAAAQAAKEEAENARLNTMPGVTNPMFSQPPTPFVDGGNPLDIPSTAGKVTPAVGTPAEEKVQSDILVPKKAEDKPPAAPSSGGWFWQRRTASRSTNTVSAEGR